MTKPFDTISAMVEYVENTTCHAVIEGQFAIIRVCLKADGSVGIYVNGEETTESLASVVHDYIWHKD